MPSQTDLTKQLLASSDPIEQRDLALELLALTHSRQHIDTALRVLKREEIIPLLDHSHRPVLREKAAHYFDQPAKDKAGLIREQIVRLLIHIGHPADHDLYQRSVATYEAQLGKDVVQNLRAAGLVGLVMANEALGCAYATRLLGEEDTSQLNCEPSMTAVAVLANRAQILPIYQFLLLKGEAFVREAKGEVVGSALELLGEDFPLSLYEPLATSFVVLDSPVVSMGIANYIMEHRRDGLYGLLEQVIGETRHLDLHRYILLMIAASRDEVLTNILYRMAKSCSSVQVKNFIEAIDLSIHPARDELLTMLNKRV